MNEHQVTLFLTHFREHGLEATAAEAAGVSVRKVRAHLEKDDDFAAAYEHAEELAMDRDEAEARRRAVEGVEEPVIYQGNVTYLYEDVVDEDGNVVYHPAFPDTPLRRPVLNPDGSHKILTVRKHSDSLLAQRLKGRRRKVYGDKTEITGANGGPLVEVVVKQFLPPVQPLDITPARQQELINELA